jgi:glutamate N-acetyltransferase/amino-acid N-acetyltransferase
MTIYSINGVKFSAIEASIKYQDRKDLALVTFSVNTIVAGAFSTSSIVSSTIDWCKKNISNSPKALLVNSGNANSFTGKHGKLAIEKTTEELAKKLGISQNEILVSSTGVIGEKLPYEKIINKYDELISTLSENSLNDVAHAIMTTDTKPKINSIETNIEGTTVKISAIAKGAGMLAPNLATMLAYFFTDAKISKSALNKIFLEVIEDTFNSITIDGDMSTNDTALIFATGAAGNEEITESNCQEFKTALKKLLSQICEDIMKDGEGVTKLAKIYVSGAESKKSAKKVAFAIANSPLVKTALNGSDPNWGRIVMAVGKSKEPLDLTKFSLSIGEFNIVKNGELNESYDEATTTAKYMKQENIEIHINLGLNQEQNQAIITTCDLSKGYIEINADYRS